MADKSSMKDTFSAGSALILAMVLTSLLAIVGVMFVMVSRVDRMSTSAISENKELNLAVETIVAKISQELIFDIPGAVDPNQEYQDYPYHTVHPGGDGQIGTDDDVTIYDIGPDGIAGTADDITYYGLMDDIWLANLEPEIVDYGVELGQSPDTSTAIGFRHITDLYGRLAYLFQDSYDGSVVRYTDSDDDRIGFRNMRAVIVSPTAAIQEGYKADADGDGVADSRWIELPNMTSKGRPIYAAVRVVDNGGMLNVNTAYKFNPAETNRRRIDGSSQMQINLMALAGRPPIPPAPAEEQALLDARNPQNLGAYERDVVWRYGRPSGNYTPFDISDELELRNRFLLNHEDIDTRLEPWGGEFRRSTELSTPVVLGSELDRWFYRTQHDILGPDDIYSYRHLATTYNMDRIIRPDGAKMLNVNVAAADFIYGAILDVRTAEPNSFWIGNDVAAQMAVNIRDYVDNDSEVSILVRDGISYYGFERPCIFISELAHRFKADPRPGIEYRSYGIELRKRYRQGRIKNLDEWRLAIDGIEIPIRDNFGRDGRRYHIMLFEDPNAELSSSVRFSDSPDDGETGVDPEVTLGWSPLPEELKDPNSPYSYDVYFAEGCEDCNDDKVCEDVEMAGPNSPEFIVNQPNNVNFYDPCGPGVPLDVNTTYCWRIDDIKDSEPNESAGSSGALRFTTWDKEPNLIYGVIGPGDIIFSAGSVIELRRYLAQTGYTEYLVVDLRVVPDWLVAPVEGVRSFQRDVTLNRWIKRLWQRDLAEASLYLPTLGHTGRGANLFRRLDVPGIQARIPNGSFTNIGEIGLVLQRSAYMDKPPAIGPLESDFTTKINLADLYIQQLFRYLTVTAMDPDYHGYGVAETRVKGRININTAPWYVMAQLPWVSTTHTPNLARAIVAYRDKMPGPGNNDYRLRFGDPGFRSIGELNRIVDSNAICSIDYYWLDGEDQWGFPDLTGYNRRVRRDGVADDFEERDLIFARISNLVTVRSDVFTAYILVRIGADGPQKRVIAILDRSEAPSRAVRVRALHPVPDPR